jgi:glyoxylase-like metal-dependent hydrolase (beta-lactamase superfamily II)
LHKAAAHWPVVTYSEGLTIHFNGEAVQVLAVPGGHTDNDSIVIFKESNVIHMGDLFNSGRTSYPLAHLAAGGNALRILENIEKILPLVPADAKVIAGHGPLSNRDGLADLQDMLAFTIEFVRTRKARGLTLAEIQSEGFPDQYDEWNGYITATDWMEMIYQSL